jgi:septal ring factor EnvC (AmiA/AmiB activator)
MDGDDMKRRGRKSFWRQKQFLIAGAIMVVAAAAMTWVYMSARNGVQDKQLAKAESTETEEVKTNTEEPAASVTKIITPKPKGEDETAKIATETAAPKPEPQPDTTTQNKAATANTNNVQKTLHFSADSGMNWPLQGNVILNYSMDQTVYFSTLDQYKYNPAVIIAGTVNAPVKSAAAGKITDISNNEETGCTVTEDLGDGYSAIYGQLKEVPCKVGDYVDAGSTIGYLSEPTKYYSVEGCNLYFEVKKDGTPVDPVTFFQ